MVNVDCFHGQLYLVVSYEGHVCLPLELFMNRNLTEKMMKTCLILDFFVLN